MPFRHTSGGAVSSPVPWVCGVSCTSPKRVSGSIFSLCERTHWLFDIVSPKAWGFRANPKGGGTGVNCWEANQKSNKQGESCLFFWGTLGVGLLPALLLERFYTSLVDPGFAPPFGKGVSKKYRVQGQKWKHLLQGKDVDSVAIFAFK